MARERFDHKDIEQKAQDKWAALNLYETDLTDGAKEPYYLLFEFPYPSGDLHIGHWYAFALTDVFARMKRMQGKNVLFPMGFDSFGLPAENAAIKYGKDPAAWTEANMETMRAQVRSMGTSVDWSKEVVTSSPAYYKWTQWLFTKLYEQGLAYRKEAAVKWCPKDQTVLANEQVTDGKCERCGSEVEEKSLTQWFMSITKYADRLLSDLDPLPWREEIKEAQRAWIGKSEGAQIPFRIVFHDEARDSWRDKDGNPAQVRVFTTRPDTIFGATYLVLAPEHPWVKGALKHQAVSNIAAVEAYIDSASKKTERERQENKDKTGVRLEGIMAVNPATEEEIPVYIADYVLASYGTGAVMAVPAHDERDFEFSQKMRLPVRHVIAPCFTDERNPPREGAEVIRRRLTISIVHDPKTDRYLALEWPQQGWTTFVTGGIEEGEDAVESAKREIAEETGYTDVAFVRALSGETEAYFHASHKGVNRISNTQTLLFTLKSDARTAVDAAEEAQHTPVWLPKEELTRARFAHAEMDLLMERLEKEMPYTGDGALIHSGAFSGRNNREAFDDIVSAIDGEKVTNYRLRDWLVSRQRYWGCPIPMVYDPEGNPHPVPSEHLPWLLPTDVDFTPSGKSPLATSKELKERVTRIFGEGWTPEYDTLDTFVDSSWYFLRYLDSKDEHDFTDQALLKKWLPVNRYSGGSEHTTMHLLYARFFTKALHDLALVPVAEPFIERYNRGLILGPDGAKMSKSKGNVVNPDAVVKEHGADAVRLYLAFIGPYNEPGNYPWNLDGVASMRRFLDRVYALSKRVAEGTVSEDEHRALAKAVEKVTDDTERFKLNTALSALMVLVRDFEQLPAVSRDAFRELLTLLAPYAPHLAEHMWEAQGFEGSVHAALWPAREALPTEAVTVVVQVNGKKKGEVLLRPDAGEEEALGAAKILPAVHEALAAGKLVKQVYVPGRIVNFVIQ
ncbi:MAG TPA: class I tRNA ligase family protein [Candidatus Paceibacterota bacterium]|nr:class I tRNA ligase family protein [Candidatus Paceibacterota bacterium]